MKTHASIIEIEALMTISRTANYKGLKELLSNYNFTNLCLKHALFELGVYHNHKPTPESQEFKEKKF